jgi:Nucleotide modification associated domain 3/Nucleotide modification associated domain 2
MRVIFSRKGFDSESGGVPSPIIDDHFIFLPIPATRRSVTTYRDLGLGEIVEDLTRGRIRRNGLCHNDPDLRLGALGAPGAHLRNQRVGPDDIFLFWGLYRPAENTRNVYSYVRSARKEHWLFGWLQVAEVVDLGEDGSWLARERPEFAQHPHCRSGWGTHNTLYVAAKKIRLGGRTLDVPGAGMFPQAEERLRLTVKGESCSLWKRPSWLNPCVGLSYHRDPSRYGPGTLRVVARGQEFVADVDDDPMVLAWLEELFQNTKASQYPTPQFKAIGSPFRRPEGRVWRYIVANDGGTAPCIYGRRMLSLCICKPVIRRGADLGDWVIGFMPKRFGYGRVVWAGRVSEILPMGQYRMRYPRRPDAIYTLLRVTPDGGEVLERTGVGIHADKKSQERDKRGINALIFREFWYWGGDAPPAPAKIAGLAYYRQGQTTRNAGPKEAEELEEWLSQWPSGVHGQPRDAAAKRSNRSC